MLNNIFKKKIESLDSEEIKYIQDKIAGITKDMVIKKAKEYAIPVALITIPSVIIFRKKSYNKGYLDGMDMILTSFCGFTRF